MDMRKLIETVRHLDEAGQFDVTDLQRRYDHYNALLFDNKLPIIPLAFKKLKNVGGHVVVRYRVDTPMPRRMMRYAKKTMIPGSMHMEISTMYQREPQALDAILIHEMIHVYFYSIGDLDENHGDPFIKMARELSQKVGFTIPLKDDIVGLQLTDAPSKKIGMIVLTKRDGSRSVALTPESYMRSRLNEMIERWQTMTGFALVQVQFVIASGRIEAAFPLQRKPKLMDIGFYKTQKDPAMLDEALEAGDAHGARQPKPALTGSASILAGHLNSHMRDFIPSSKPCCSKQTRTLTIRSHGSMRTLCRSIN